jgi:phosphatidylglycerol:prolipoprotein diacylglycerol transferase
VLPYVDLPTLGPITAFGILATLGAVSAGIAVSRHGARLGLPADQLRRMWVYCGVGGILGAHYLDLFLYQPGWQDAPDAVWRFFNPFAGISSYGGILGGTVGFLVWSRKHRVHRLRYAEAAAIGVVVLMTFGRAGCATAHDHVGVATDFALAVDFPSIGPHHDLGLYEFALYALVLLPVSLFLLRTPRRAGFYVGFIAIAYAVPRFFLDNLRRESIDPRYFALTPAQWCCIATTVVGVVLLARLRSQPPPAPYITASA